jgi:hypothetical protein
MHSAALVTIRTAISVQKDPKECRSKAGIWRNTESVSGSYNGRVGTT